MIQVPCHCLFWSFLKIGACAIGGGLAALPIFEAELVQRRHWLTTTDIAEAYAISQSVPGIIVINFAVLASLRLSGKRGALLAAFAVALPAFFFILALSVLADGHWENRWVASALSGLRPAVLALIACTAIRLGRARLRSPGLALAAAAGAFLMLQNILGPVPLIFIGATTGIGLHLLRRPKALKP